MKVCVLLPAYNEADRIGDLIKEIISYNLDVLVIDDGSLDETAKNAKAAKAVVISHPENMGKGQALRTGFKFLKESDYDAVIVMDADGQHLPGEINNFISRTEESQAGIIIGNRMGNPKGMPVIRELTNKVTSMIVSKVIKTKIPDSQCGFRLIRTDLIKELNLSTAKYETESEILIEAVNNGFTIDSISIESVYTDQKSKINPFYDTLRFLKLMGRHILKKQAR